MQIDEMAGATSGRQEKLAEQIALAIERDIIEFALPAGTNLGREGDLTARFGVSRSVFREAVRLVVDSGLASVRRGHQGGLIVIEINP